MADWFKACSVTGVYWIPVYEILEQRGFDVILVNARYAKSVPGRKIDVSDAARLRELNSYDLVRGSFRHVAEIATLRAYLHQGERLVEYAAARIQRMQHSAFAIRKARGQRDINVNTRFAPSVLPKDTDLSIHSADEIAAVAAALDDRPRKALRWKTPAEALGELLP